MITIVSFTLFCGCKESTQSSQPPPQTENNQVIPNDNISEEINSFVPDKNLSKDIRSFQIQINDQLYSFPVYYKDFIKSGWCIDEKSNGVDTMLQSGMRDIVRFKNGSEYLDCYIYNPDISIQTYENCVISGLIAETQFGIKETKLFIPGNLQVGISTADDVLATHGEPDKKNKPSDTRTYFDYTTDNVWLNITLIFDEKDILITYELENPVAPVGFVYSDPEDIELDYHIPTILGNNVEDRIVNLEGELYVLPAPVSVFIDNGWIIEDEIEEIIAGDSVITNLHRGSETVDVRIVNYSDVAYNIEDAYVSKLSVDSITFKGEFIVSGGIHLYMNQGQLELILSENNYNYQKKNHLWV